MHRIQLFVNNQKVDLPEELSLPMNWTFTDLTHPTAVKNSFSKTLTLPGTPTNNSVFDKFFDTKHLIVNFDPADRIPFELFSGSSLIETGYVTLNRVVRSSSSWNYEVTLYGGLGDFLFSISSSTLEDLSTYFGTDVTINKELVKEDWDSNRSLSKSICWVPEYGGINDGFQSDKVTYGPDQTLELEDEIDQFSMGDFRSWCQRPAVFVSEIVNGICAESGFNVEIDQEWTSQTNPYWENLVVTMPKLEFEERDTTFDTSAFAFNPFYESLAPSDASFYVDWQTVNTVNLENIGHIVQPTLETNLEMFFTTQSTLYPEHAKLYNEDTIFLTFELCFYDSSTKGFWETGDRIVICSPNANWTSKEHDIIFRWSEIVKDEARSVYDPVQKVSTVYWQPKFYDEDLEQVLGIVHHKFEFDSIMTTGMTNVVPAILFNGSHYVELSMSNNKLHFKYSTNDSIHSGKMLTWPDIVKSDVNQCDFLLSYMKTFGLMMTQDKRTKSVHIMPRNAFFRDYEILDWTGKLDLSKEVELKPLNFDKRWFSFAFGPAESSYLEAYSKRFDTSYGSYVHDTRLLTNDETKEMLSGTVFTCPFTTTEYIWHYLFNLVPGGALEPSATTEYDPVPRPSNFTWNGYTREPADNDMQLFFRSGRQSPQWKCWISDDTPTMTFNQEFNYIYPSPSLASLYTKKVQFLPVYSDYLSTKDGWSDNWSLQWAKPQKTFNGLSYSDESASLFSRFWQKFVEDIYDKNTKVLTGYFRLTPEDIANFSFKDFVFIDGQLWHVNSIIDWDAASYSTTKVELVQVQDIANYVSGQRYSGTKEWFLTIDNAMISLTANPGFFSLAFQTNSNYPVQMVYCSDPDMMAFDPKTNTLSVTENQTTVTRTGYCLFGIQEDGSKTVRVNVSQDAKTISYFLSPSSYDVGLTFEAQKFLGVSTNGTLTKVSGPNWLYWDSVDQVFGVIENDTTESRSGTSIYSLAEDTTKTITITAFQSANVVEYYCTTNISETTVDQNEQTIANVFSSNGTLVCQNTETWFKVLADGSVSVQANTNDFGNKYSYMRWSKLRSTPVPVMVSEDHSKTGNLTLTQSPEYAIRSELDLTQSPYVYNGNLDGETIDPKIKTNGTIVAQTPTGSWVTVNSDGTITVAANTSSRKRTGKITYQIAERSDVAFQFQIVQDPGVVEYYLTPETYSSRPGCLAGVILTPETNGTLVRSSGSLWIYTDGTTIKVLENTQTRTRSGTATFTLEEDSSKTLTVSVTQTGKLETEN